MGASLCGSHYRPGRWEGQPGAGQHTLAHGLHFGDEGLLVHEQGSVVLHHHAAVNQDGVDAAPVGIVDQAVDRVEERGPLGAASVVEGEVGLLARLDGADFVAQPQRLRPAMVANSSAVSAVMAVVLRRASLYSTAMRYMARLVSMRLELLPASVPMPTVIPASSISGSSPSEVMNPKPDLTAAVGTATTLAPVRASVHFRLVQAQAVGHHDVFA